MEFILSAAYTCLFLFLILRLRFFRGLGLPIWAFPTIFLVKIFSGLLMAFIYTYYYTDRSTADIFRYFDDSAVLYRTAFNAPVDFLRMLSGYHSTDPDLHVYYNEMNSWYREFSLNNDNRSMIRLNALMRFFSMNYFYVHVVFMSFISMIGLTALYKVFLSHVKDRRYELLAIVFLLPSVMFWGSGLLKDGLMLFALGLLLLYLNKALEKNINISILFAILFFSFILIISRAYIMAAILPGILSWIWISKSGKRAWLKFLFVHAAYLFLVFNIHYVMPHGYYNALNLLAARQRNFLELAEVSNAGSLLSIHKLEASYFSLFHNLPEALWNVMMKPSVFDSFSPLILMAGLENLFILVCLIFSLYCFKRPVKLPPLFWLSLGFVLICFSLTGLVTPVAGAIVRYKMPVLPFLFLIFIVISDQIKQKKILLAFKFFFKRGTKKNMS